MDSGRRWWWARSWWTRKRRGPAHGYVHCPAHGGWQDVHSDVQRQNSLNDATALLAVAYGCGFRSAAGAALGCLWFTVARRAAPTLQLSAGIPDRHIATAKTIARSPVVSR